MPEYYQGQQGILAMAMVHLARQYHTLHSALCKLCKLCRYGIIMLHAPPCSHLRHNHCP